ncbi:tetratricopeptide repeat protein [Rhodopseudomonas palustris]|nr:tetratricopeptide repeat protein [Rhodopseudomonas palustris]
MRWLSAAGVLLALLAAAPALATGVDDLDDPTLDPAPCLAAAAQRDDDRAVELCGRLIAKRNTGRDDRIKALIARAGALIRKQQIDRALADYDDVLRLDPKQPDIHNARGELWLGKGDHPKALADFSAALKLRRDHPAARANHRALATELERLGVQKAVDGKPSFDCRRARRAVEKAICGDRDLANLDREIAAMHLRILQDKASAKPAELRALKRAQADFLANRNASFGRPGYDLRAAMKTRLQQLTGAAGGR